jgi:ferredoxin-NADP reductase
MTLLVAYRSQADLICWKDLEALRNKPGIRILTTLTREDASSLGFLYGRPDSKLFEQACEGTYADATDMTCGPEAMMKNVCEFLQAKGVPEQHVMLESFGE